MDFLTAIRVRLTFLLLLLPSLHDHALADKGSSAQTLYELDAFSSLLPCARQCFGEGGDCCSCDKVASILGCDYDCGKGVGGPNSCYCRADRMSTANVYLSTCVKTRCGGVGDYHIDLTSVSRLYNGYCNDLGYSEATTTKEEDMTTMTTVTVELADEPTTGDGVTTVTRSTSGEEAMSTDTEDAETSSPSSEAIPTDSEDTGTSQSGEAMPTDAHDTGTSTVLPGGGGGQAGGLSAGSKAAIALGVIVIVALLLGANFMAYRMMRKRRELGYNGERRGPGYTREDATLPGPPPGYVNTTPVEAPIKR